MLHDEVRHGLGPGNWREELNSSGLVRCLGGDGGVAKLAMTGPASSSISTRTSLSDLGFGRWPPSLFECSLPANPVFLTGATMLSASAVYGQCFFFSQVKSAPSLSQFLCCYFGGPVESCAFSFASCHARAGRVTRASTAHRTLRRLTNSARALPLFQPEVTMFWSCVSTSCGRCDLCRFSWKVLRMISTRSVGVV